MLSHKQRNNWCTVVSVHLGEQIDVEISKKKKQFPFDASLARRWLMRVHCKRTSAVMIRLVIGASL